MMAILSNFFSMDGYGKYVFSAYGIVLIFLSIQIILPWRRWRHFLREQKQSNNE